MIVKRKVRPSSYLEEPARPGPPRPVAALALGGAGCVYNSRRRTVAVPSASHRARNSSARNKDVPAAWPARAAPKTSPPS